MQLKTILNRIQKHSSFVYETVRLVEHPRLTLEVRGASPRRGPWRWPVPPPGPGLRHAGAAALRLCVPLASGRLRLRDAPRVVPALRRPCEAVPWGTGKHRVTRPRRSSPGGPSDVVARGRRGVPDLLGHRPSSRPHGGRLGAVRTATSRRSQRSAWTSRAPARAPIPDVGLPDRPPPSASAVGRARTQGATLQAFFRLVRRGAQCKRCASSARTCGSPTCRWSERAGQAVHVLDRFHIMSHYLDAFTWRWNLCLERQVAVLYRGLFVQDVCRWPRWNQ